MKIYDYTTAEVVEISDSQYDFLQAMVKHGGKMDDAVKEYPVSQEQIDNWKQDKIYWPVLESYITVLMRSRGLSADYIKDYLMGTLAGKSQPSSQQMQALNLSAKILGLGLQPRVGFGGKVTVGPSNTEIIFQDGLPNENK